MRTAIGSLFFFICLVADRKEMNAQAGTTYNLAQLFKDKKLTVFNRTVNLETDASKNGIALSEEEGEGLVWINGVSFSTGTIEVDLKGQDVFQHSFVGIAFHCVDDSTFDAIYFRPFQFNTDDAARRKRAVQYVSLPAYTWQKLREQHYGFYENQVEPAPDPNDWFHVKMIVKERELQVFVNNSVAPCLRINLLNDRKNGEIALYTADRSGGSFANLIIRTD